MNQIPKFQEEYSAKIPALVLLMNLGWNCISAEQAIIERSGKIKEVVLKDVLRNELRKRRFIYADKEHELSKSTIESIVSEINTPALNEGLMAANEKIYNHLLYGISVTEFIDGKKVNPTIPLVDWNEISNNSFIITEEFGVLRSSVTDTRRPDIVCFVNGIPFVVIEAKRPDGDARKGPTIDAGISQSLRNQRNDEIPQLFAYSQLLLSINGNEGRFGTQGTDAKFWSAWREEDFTEAEMVAIKNKKLSDSQKSVIFKPRHINDLKWHEALTYKSDLAITGQDKILISLLTPSRLLEITRLFTVFDKKLGKVITRYHQFFGIKRLIERINTLRPDGGREGGVMWHTTGSGKSLTMLLLSKALILHESLKECRIIIVTDRTDLESQLSTTFISGGELASKRDKQSAMATSGKRLAEQIGKGNERIVFTLVQKFNIAAKNPQCFNDSANIIVLIDEGHRSQGGENHIRMKRALPNASFIAFTGTPLLKEDKTVNKFGSIVHAYTMQRAVEDKAITPLLYEERIPDLDINERAIDSWFDRITLGLKEDQKYDLKRKFAQKGQIYESDDRIRLIALDIANHFTKNIDDGLKGQLACESKQAAIKYKKYLDETGLFESAVVISAPDSREGNTSIDESNIPEVTKWWKENIGNQDEKIYTKNVIGRFGNDDNLKLLIVVDKLLTGFDEPKNTVLYIDKPLKEHGLLQAIARVNRLHEKKSYGLLIDYRGILKQLDSTIAKYQDLASRTQGGFDINDLSGLLRLMSSEYKKLPNLYKKLWAIFNNVKNKSDIEQLRQVLVPRMQELEGELIDVNLKTRDDFYEALSDFTICLKVALQSATFFDDKYFTESDREQYKETVKQLSSLRQLVRHDAGETVNYDEYSDQVRKLMDKHVVGVAVKEPSGVYEVGKMGLKQNPDDWSEEKTRNETDIIKTRITKMIEQDLGDDPYAQESFSKLLRKAIEEAEQLFEHPMKQYLLFREFEDQVKKRKLDDIPREFEGSPHAQAFFGIFKKILPSTLFDLNTSDLNKWIELSFTIDKLVTNAVAENSINPQNIEADIRKKTLPIVFKECKSIGAGMDQAKAIIEWIVQIVRIGLNGSI